MVQLIFIASFPLPFSLKFSTLCKFWKIVYSIPRVPTQQQPKAKSGDAAPGRIVVWKNDSAGSGKRNDEHCHCWCRSYCHICTAFTRGFHTCCFHSDHRQPWHSCEEVASLQSFSPSAIRDGRPPCPSPLAQAISPDHFHSLGSAMFNLFHLTAHMK